MNELTFIELLVLENADLDTKLSWLYEKYTKTLTFKLISSFLRSVEKNFMKDKLNVILFLFLYSIPKKILIRHRKKQKF